VGVRGNRRSGAVGRAGGGAVGWASGPSTFVGEVGPGPYRAVEPSGGVVRARSEEGYKACRSCAANF